VVAWTAACGCVLYGRDRKGLGRQRKAAVATHARCAPHTVSCPSTLARCAGKSGAVAARLAISLRSIGVRASFVHGSEWVHGDLGGVGAGDVALLLSHSGRTVELVDVARRLAAKRVVVAAITSDAASPLAAAAAAHFLALGEGELLGRVPTRSVVAQEAVANALLTAVAQAGGLTAAGFAAHHPGGAIGADVARGA